VRAFSLLFARVTIVLSIVLFSRFGNTTAINTYLLTSASADIHACEQLRSAAVACVVVPALDYIGNW